MNAQALPEICAEDNYDDFDDEKIEVAHIRIGRANSQRAVLGAFREADRLLGTWVDAVRSDMQFDFEVTFIDGYVFKGKYEFWRKSRRRPSLSRHVGEAFAALWQGGKSDMSRYDVNAA